MLRALITHPGFFRAGICLYGVADLFGMAADTHKFEDRYMDSLVGPLPQAADLYRERSPVFHADEIQDPVAVFQGADDEVVPKAQSDRSWRRCGRQGVPHEYHVYEGEGHGWRKPETIAAFWQAVDTFLRRYVVLNGPDDPRRRAPADSQQSERAGMSRRRFRAPEPGGPGDPYQRDGMSQNCG